LDAFNRWDHIPQKLKYFELSKDEWGQFHRVISNIANRRRKLERVIGVSQGDFLIFNEKGTRSPIYWCFNDWSEALLLARKLGDDQPLVAMHSLYSVTKNWRTKTRFHEHLALRYFENIDPKNCKGPLVFGGNCQAAPLAESIAILTSKKLNIQPLVITMEYVPRRQYRGPMLMLFGRESGFNPFFNSNMEPVSIWNSSHRDFAWGFLDACHGGYFKEPAIDQLKRYIEKTVAIFKLKEGSQSAIFVRPLD